jgi:hypothetical protein
MTRSILLLILLAGILPAEAAGDPREEALERYERLGLPDAAGKEFVRLDAGQKGDVYGWRLSGDEGQVVLLTDNLGVETYPLSGDPGQLQAVDFPAFRDRFLAEGPDSNSFWIDQDDWRFRIHAVLAVQYAAWCRQRGRLGAAAEILALADESVRRGYRQGSEEPPALPDFVAEAIGVDLRSRAVRAAADGAPRTDLLARWRLIASVLEGHDDARARLLAGAYERMVAEDEAFREPAPEELARMTADERARTWIYKLRDIANRPFVHPGNVSIFPHRIKMADGTRLPPGEMDAAERLEEMGWDALPVLIEHLEDPRPTRSTGSGIPSGYLWVLLSTGEGCQEIFQAITGLRPPREDPRRWAEEWWESAGKFGPRSCFARILDSSDPSERRKAAGELLARDPAAFAPLVIGKLAEHGVAARPEFLEAAEAHLGPEHRPLLEGALGSRDLRTLALVARILWERFGADSGLEPLGRLLLAADEGTARGWWPGPAEPVNFLSRVDRPAAVEAMCALVRKSARTVRECALESAPNVQWPGMLEALLEVLGDRTPRWPGDERARWCDLAAKAIRHLLRYAPEFPEAAAPEARDAWIGELRAWVGETAPTLDWEALRR